MKDNTAKAVLCAALGHIIWGFSFLFTKTALSVVSDPNVILAHRFIISTLIMACFILTGKEKLSFKGKDWKSVVLLMLMQVLYYLFETYGLHYTNTIPIGGGKRARGFQGIRALPGM